MEASETDSADRKAALLSRLEQLIDLCENAARAFNDCDVDDTLHRNRCVGRHDELKRLEEVLRQAASDVENKWDGIKGNQDEWATQVVDTTPKILLGSSKTLFSSHDGDAVDATITEAGFSGEDASKWRALHYRLQTLERELNQLSSISSEGGPTQDQPASGARPKRRKSSAIRSDPAESSPSSSSPSDRRPSRTRNLEDQGTEPHFKSHLYFFRNLKFGDK